MLVARARCPHHKGPTAVLALTDGATSLWTGSWDGSVRRIDLRPLVQEPQAALEDANRYWGAVPGLVGGARRVTLAFAVLSLCRIGHLFMVC